MELFYPESIINGRKKTLQIFSLLLNCMRAHLKHSSSFFATFDVYVLHINSPSARKMPRKKKYIFPSRTQNFAFPTDVHCCVYRSIEHFWFFGSRTYISRQHSWYVLDYISVAHRLYKILLSCTQSLFNEIKLHAAKIGYTVVSILQFMDVC